MQSRAARDDRPRREDRFRDDRPRGDRGERRPLAEDEGSAGAVPAMSVPLDQE
jgi:hypothetical protein